MAGVLAPTASLHSAALTVRRPKASATASIASCSTSCVRLPRRQPVLAFRHATHQLPSVSSSPTSCSRQQPAETSCRLCGVSRLTISAEAGVSHPGEERASGSELSASLRVPTSGMARGLGSFGGATLERSKLDTSREVKTVDPRTDDSGGGGAGGKGIFNGGGGDSGDGDDDDYFDNFGDGDGEGGDEGFFRAVVGQLYDRASLQAVLAEWFRSIESLPAIIRQSVEMGLFSSAQLVRFMSMDVRPNVTRAVTRCLPATMSRGVVGRLMADPAFVQKLLMEELITISSSLYYEARQRGERFSKELDFVAANTLSLAVATGALVWLVAPSRSYGAVHKMPWQQLLHNLPNHAFDAASPLRNYTLGARVGALVAKGAQLAVVGAGAGTAMAGLNHAALSARRLRDPQFQPTLPVPSWRRSAGGLAVSMGLFSNLRYQLIGGIDRYLFDHSNFLWSYLTASSMFRVVSNVVGEPTRQFLQGLPTTFPQRQSSAALAAAVARHAQSSARGRVTVVKPTKKRSGKKAAGKKTVRKARGFEMSASMPQHAELATAGA